MRPIEEVEKDYRFTLNEYNPGVDGWGFFQLPGEICPATVKFNMGNSRSENGWECVSMGLKYRFPIYEEVLLLKEVFFEDYELVSFYPETDSEAFCLHYVNLWHNKNQKLDISFNLQRAEFLN
ncbi:MAG: hypothetical protein LKJ13_04575 [Clostridia bacterium]|nr:hypothetical protein [Clostridia bacterium]MCI1959098.1 hypothetical protein [Clostridia bacterium]MCI2000863.1 hypothetical protein [Clostridia bacterium]MCI2015345.1 hypothetical protein [Clostridia bacterium]